MSRAEPIQGEVAFATSGLFPMLGVAPMLGRPFSEAEARESADVAMVSAGFWRRVLGGSSAAIGASIRIDGTPVTVIGVMPDSFKFPNWDEPNPWLQGFLFVLFVGLLCTEWLYRRWWGLT